MEGENHIDFRQPPFADTGVFAITGPNGSGKSSILDALTLGLYGETYRFDRPAQHVMTRNTTESYAQVEFATGEDIYQANWSVQREKNEPTGRLLAPKMKLMRITGEDEILAETAETVCQRISEITGMNFRNFTRSIMLAQGDFAAFLNALDNERLDILEKIISTDVYSDYKNAVIAKTDEAQAVLDLLNEELSSLELLEPEQLAASEQDLVDFNEQLVEFKQQQTTLEQQHSQCRQIAAIEQRIAALTDKQQNLQLQLKVEQDQCDKIAAGQGALAYQEDCAQLERSKQDIEETRVTLAAYRNECRQIQDKLAVSDGSAAPETQASVKSVAEQQAAIAAEKEKVALYTLEKQSETHLLHSSEKQRNEKQAALTTVDAWLEAHVIDKNLLENFPETGKLKNLRTQIATLTATQKSAAKWLQDNRSAFDKNTATLQKSTRKIARLKLKLQIDEQKLEGLALGRDAGQINELLRDQQERIADFQELYQLSRAHARLTRRRLGLFGLRREREEQSTAQLQTGLTRLKDDLRREDNIRKALEKAIVNENLLAKMAADRQHLIEGKPCPLCGSLTHPYVQKPPKATDSKRALADQRAKVQALAAGIERVGLEIRSAQRQSEINQANQQRTAQLLSQWLTLCNRLNAVSEDLDINNSRKMKKLLKTQQSELKNITLLAKKYRLKQKNIEKIKQLIARHEALVLSSKNTAETLESQRQGRPDELEKQAQTLAQLQQDEKELTLKVTEQLAQMNEKMPAKGKEDAFFERMNLRRQDYQSYALRRKNLVSELAALDEKIAASQTILAELKQKLEIAGNLLQQEEQAGLHLALIEKQKLIAEKERVLGQQDHDEALLRETLQQKIQHSGLADVNELIGLLHLVERKPELEQQLLKLTGELESVTAELQQEQARLANQQAQLSTDASDADISFELKVLAEKTDIAGHEIQRLERLLGQQELLRQKYETLTSKQIAQQEILQECLGEVQQLDAEHGAVFRRRVQVKMADKLLAKANQTLEKISGRYYLRQMPSDQGLALEIEDTFQHNTRRLPKTLSGGESFVVSLALALALSELASNGQSVDSLFLDEGFGSLDAETLYVVISTLEALHSQGKKVGVISHVEAVQKRIKAQLQMAKKPNGMSYLKGIFDQEVVF